MNDHPPSPQTRRRDSLDDGSTPQAAPFAIDVVDEQAPDRGAPAVDADRWRALALGVLGTVEVAPPAELSVLFVDEGPMSELNEQYMGHVGPTDVLSFPIDDEEPTAIGEVRVLGDVVICPRVAARNAPDHAGTYDDEVALLLIHGVLHLLGMDHAEHAEREAMQARERELLAAHHGRTARDPWS